MVNILKVWAFSTLRCKKPKPLMNYKNLAVFECLTLKYYIDTIEANEIIFLSNSNSTNSSISIRMFIIQ